MADPKIRIRRSATPNKVPTTTQLQLGELAINTYDGKVYLEQDQGGVGVGTTVIAVNPWGVGIGSTAYNTQFTAGKVGIGTTNAQYNLDIGGNVNFTGNLYQDGSLYTSGTTGVGIRTAGGIVGYAATILDFRGPGVTTAYYSSATGIGTINFHSVTTGGGGGNASVTVSDSAPSSPSNGDLWFKSDVGELYLWYTDGSSNQWVEASGGSNTVVTQDTAPSNPNDGDLWWNSNTGELKVYYNDGNSSQWVDANSEGGFVQYWTQTNTNGTLGVTTTGYVGIGTTTATDALTVVGAADIDGNLIVSGVTTFSGDVKVGGVLTYEDVKNVDAIGVVTARTGLKVLAGGANIVDGTTTDELKVTGIATVTQLKATTVNVTGVTTATGGVKVGTAATICSAGNMTIDKPGAGIITATKFIGDGSDLTGVISGIGIGTAGGVVGYAATIVHFKGAGVTTAYYNASTGIGTVFFHSAGGGGGGANVTVSDTPPGSPTAGDLWWESDIGELKIYYSDGDSSQWVDASGADSLVQIGTSAPTGAVSGDLWFNSETGDFMVYYTDANSSAWVSVNAVNSNTKWLANSTGIHTSSYVGIGTTTVTDALTVVGATDLDGRLIVSGITTFGSHVYHGDNDNAIFGDGSDLSIWHNGTNSHIRNTEGDFVIDNSGGGGLFLRAKQNENSIYAVPDAQVQLYHNNVKKIETTLGGAKVWGTVGSANTALVVVGDARVTGILTVGTGSLKITDRDINMVGVITGANFKSGTTNVHNVGVEAAGINVLGADTPIGTGATVYNSGLIVGKKGAEFQGVVTATTFSGNATTATLATNAQGLTGTPNITVGALTATTGQFSGNVNVLGTLTYEDVKNVDSAGIATARQGLRITGGGLDVVGVSTFNDNVKLLDNDVLQIGTGQDLSIWHDASDTQIKNTTGELQIRGDTVVLAASTAYEKYIKGTYNGAVELYHNNVKKFATNSDGVDLGDNVKLRIGDAPDYKIYHNGSNTYHENYTGDLFIKSDQMYLASWTSGEHYLHAVKDGRVALYYNDTVKFETTNTGVKITSSTNGDGINLLSGNNSSTIYLDANRSSANNGIGQVCGRWNGTTVAQMSFSCGSDATNKDDGFIWFGTESAASNGNVNATERLRIDSLGNVSIGGAAPLPHHTGYNGATLHLYQTGSSNVGGELRFTTGASGHTVSDGGYIAYWTDNNFYCNNREAGSWIFYTSNAERLRITAEGELLLGDSFSSNINTFKMGIKESANENAAILFLDTDNMRGGICGISKGTNELISGTTNVDFVLGSLYADTHIIYGQSGDTNGRIGLTIKENGGKIGINNTSPVGQLHVQAATDDNPAIIIYRTSGGGDVGSLAWRTSQGTNAYINWRGGGAAKGLQFYTSTNGNDGTSVERFRINANSNGSAVGSFGTGTTHYNQCSTPDRASFKIGGRLHVDGAFGNNAMCGLYYNCYSGGNDLFYGGTYAPSGGDGRASAITMRYGGVAIYTDSSSTAYSSQQQITTMANRFAISSIGDAYFCTTSATLYGATSGKGMHYRNTSGTLQVCAERNQGWSTVYLNKSDTHDGSDVRWIDFWWGGNQKGNITFNGSNGVNYNTTSDYRLKKDDVVITNGISRVKQLRPITFKWKEDNTSDEGFFAHEVQSVVPGAVSGTKDQVVTQAEFDADSQPESKAVGDAIHQQMDSSKLVPVLTAALKEAIAKIEVLETKVAALESS